MHKIILLHTFFAQIPYTLSLLFKIYKKKQKRILVYVIVVIVVFLSVRNRSQIISITKKFSHTTDNTPEYINKISRGVYNT